MNRFRWLNPLLTILIALLVWSTLLPEAEAQVTPASPVSENQAISTDFNQDIPLTRPQELNIIQRLTFDPSRVNQRIRVLRVIDTFGEEQVLPIGERRTADVTVFNYTRGVAEQFLVDAATGEVLREEVLPGRPQPSVSERQEAARIIQADPDLRSVLESGTTLEGGFAVASPQGATPTNRYIQMQILTADRSEILRIVTVDLTSSRVVSTSIPS